MAFPWSIIRAVNLATGHIVEDLKLGADLALVGKAPLFCRQAEVVSWFPPGEEGQRVQRTRWEHGHLTMIKDYFPRLLWQAIVRRNVLLLAMALDLSVPPLALLALFLVLLESITLAWLVVTGLAAAAVIATISNALFVGSIAVAWRRFGRDIVSGRDLLAVPAYAVRKIPTFLKFFSSRQVEWVRTRRDQEE
jgi:hypothetical protein